MAKDECQKHKITHDRVLYTSKLCHLLLAIDFPGCPFSENSRKHLQEFGFKRIGLFGWGRISAGANSEFYICIAINQTKGFGIGTAGEP